VKIRHILALLVVLGGFLPTLAAPQPVAAADFVLIYASEDTRIEEVYPTTNYGSSHILSIGSDPETYSTRSLLEFPVNWGTTIPSDAVITSAFLLVRYSGHGSPDPENRVVRAQRMLRPTWSENQATWQLYRSGYYWQTYGCGDNGDDYTTSGQAEDTIPASYGYMEWDITTQVEWAQDNDENVLVRLVMKTESSTYYATFNSRETGGTGQDPRIIIWYIQPPTVTTGSASSVLNTTATLGGTITDIGYENCDTRGFKYGLTQTDTWDVHEDGSYGTGAYSLGITSLTPGTQYWFRAYATNDAGTSYGSWVSFTTKDYPTITTVASSNVAGTSARLNSALEDDGGDPCTIKFGWGLTGQSTVDDYDNTQVLAGTYESGSYPYLDVTSLVAGQTYYFRVQGTNEIGTTQGSQLTFDTPITLSPPTNFVGYPTATTISLSWSKGTGATNTLVRYGSTTYPTTTTSGTQAYFGPGSTYTLESLTGGKTYYFSAWGESGGNYSASYSTFLMTTSAGAADDDDELEVPTQPSRWFSAPDYTSMDGLIVFYDAFNALLDTGQVPRETGWFLGALGLSVLAGLIAYLSLGRKLFIGLTTLTVCLAVGYFARLIPWWVPLMTLILTIVYHQTHKEVGKAI
jgi:hypothetical protein